MSEQQDKHEIKKWFGHVRGNLVKNIRLKIETDSTAMYRVGSFFMTCGISLETANVFALELARKIAYLEPKKIVLNKDEGIEQQIDVCQN